MPVLRGVEVAERIFIVVSSDFGVARRSRSKEHEHVIVSAGSVLRALKAVAEEGIFLVKAFPSLALAVYDELIDNLRTSLHCEFRLMRGISVCGAYNRRNSRRIKAVFKVVVQKLVSS